MYVCIINVYLHQAEGKLIDFPLLINNSATTAKQMRSTFSTHNFVLSKTLGYFFFEYELSYFQILFDIE